MNRRQLLGSFGAVLAALAIPVGELFAAPTAEAVDHGAVINNFVAEKKKAGYPDLFLFKNRSGQFVFQLYDPSSGNPTFAESAYLMHGKPDPVGGSIGRMPSLGTVGRMVGISVVAVPVDFRTGQQQLKADLNKSFRLLLAHA